MLTIFLLMTQAGFCHLREPSHYVIIDTDAAPDDLRTICTLLASPDIQVLAITTSDGACSAQTGLKKVRALLKTLHHEGVPTAAGINYLEKTPEIRAFCEQIPWGKNSFTPLYDSTNAVSLIFQELELEDKKVTVLCLGSLTNIHTAVRKDTSILQHIKRIVWYNDYPMHEGFNYLLDQKAVEELSYMDVDIEAVTFFGEPYPMDSAFLMRTDNLNSVYAGAIVRAHNNKAVQGKIKDNHLKLWDDLVPVYLLTPMLFKEIVPRSMQPCRIYSPVNEKFVKEALLKILSVEEAFDNIVFEDFPHAQSAFQDDVNQYRDSILLKHGPAEWRICVITNELHGHLGIYSLTGAKMGVRVREYLNIGLDKLKVLTFAGTHPPVSCLNDGIQVSTGATLGHGLINVSEDSVIRPEAIFYYKNRAIRMRLKDKYWDIVKHDIQGIIKQHGKLTQRYWVEVRKLALQYWKD